MEDPLNIAGGQMIKHTQFEVVVVLLFSNCDEEVSSVAEQQMYRMHTNKYR